MVTICDFYARYKNPLCLEICAGQDGLKKKIAAVDIERPGLALSGFLKGYVPKKILIFGRVEMQYIRELPDKTRISTLENIISNTLPMIIVTCNLKPFPEMIKLCNKLKVPLFRTNLKTSQILNSLTIALNDELSTNLSCHGTLVECYGVGVMIQGDSSVGKSETALGLVERRHRLISDDIVIVKKREGSYLVGTGPELTRHIIEIRGIGIINVAHLYGAVCVSESSNVDIVVRLEEWDDDHFYDRVGLEEKYTNILGIQVPFYVIPVKMGRDVVLLLETIVLNHRLKQMGYNSAKEFNVKLLETIFEQRKKLGKDVSKSNILKQLEESV